MHPHGFVLVGVVIMVLALTILGLSLFSLSSFEGQFLNQSMDDSQALASAMGGLDRARFALNIPPQNLSQVKNDLPYENVIYARAEQLKPGSPPVVDTAGVVIAGSNNDVQITVIAQYGNSTRMVTGSYIPTVQTNYYKRLLTVGALGLWVYNLVGDAQAEACRTVVLSDSIWADPTTAPNDSCAVGVFGVNTRNVPTPPVGPFIAAHAAAATPVPPDQSTYGLYGTSGRVSYWYTDNPTSTQFSSRYDHDATVTVNGYAVWMLPRGLRIDGSTTIVSGGDPHPCLVIVARDGVDEDSGLPGAVWFFGGLHADIPVILVSDGHVKIEQFDHPDDGSRADNLSVYSNEVFLTGPSETSGNYMILSYSHSTMDPLIDVLMENGALPNSVTNTPFALRPGTWRVVQ